MQLYWSNFTPEVPKNDIVLKLSYIQLRKNLEQWHGGGRLVNSWMSETMTFEIREKVPEEKDGGITTEEKNISKQFQ